MVNGASKINGGMVSILVIAFLAVFRRTFLAFSGDNVQDILTKTSDHSIVGSISNPFDDLEQGWQVLIWEHQNYVYIMEGEEPQCTEFAVWFKVGKQRYYTQWEALKRSLK